ncbi:unnamed protein product [Closterium sp. NIES-64]|nr:unnamed protein product [Closterium sp. NIES-64]
MQDELNSPPEHLPVSPPPPPFLTQSPSTHTPTPRPQSTPRIHCGGETISPAARQHSLHRPTRHPHGGSKPPPLPSGTPVSQRDARGRSEGDDESRRPARHATLTRNVATTIAFTSTHKCVLPLHLSQSLNMSRKRKLDVVEQELSSASDSNPQKLHKSSLLDSTMATATSIPVFDFPTGSIKDYFTVDADLLGSGEFGVVRRCIDSATGETFACKTIQKSRLVSESDREEVRREVGAMQRVMGHPGVVNLRAVFEDDKEVHIVMEYCEGGELFDEVIRRGRIPEKEAALLFRQIVSAVAFCHARGVMHRDLKPENILLKKQLVNGREATFAKLADFGLAIGLEEGAKATGAAGSPFYMAPEVLTGEYGVEADVWSLGVILYVLLSGNTPFWGPDDNAVFASVLAGRVDMSGPAWAGVSAEARSLIWCMLQRDPRRRPSAAKVLSHPWILVHLYGGRVVRKVVNVQQLQHERAGIAQAAGVAAAAPAAPGA